MRDRPAHQLPERGRTCRRSGISRCSDEARSPRFSLDWPIDVIGVVEKLSLFEALDFHHLGMTLALRTKRVDAVGIHDDFRCLEFS